MPGKLTNKQSILSKSGERVKNKSLIRNKRASLDAGNDYINEAELVKNYWSMKGKLEPEELKDKFVQDIFHQLHMAEKVGVYSALKNI